MFSHIGIAGLSAAGVPEGEVPVGSSRAEATGLVSAWLGMKMGASWASVQEKALLLRLLGKHPLIKCLGPRGGCSPVAITTAQGGWAPPLEGEGHPFLTFHELRILFLFLSCI